MSFPGFDGNNETAYMSYCRFIVEHEGRFTKLATPDQFNSHIPSVAIYEAMLPVWKGFGQSHEMIADQMRQLLDARPLKNRRP